MLAQEEHVEAKALKEQGWSISAIARHLGRDRKTIRTSLRPGHAPEGRTRSTDPFARFVPYTTQRLKEDPHLQLSVLLREVRALGFASSYHTLTREVRARSLRPHCEACAGVKGRATIDIPHDPGHETQWDWLELRPRGGRRPTCRWGPWPTRASSGGRSSRRRTPGICSPRCRRSSGTWAG